MKTLKSVWKRMLAGALIGMILGSMWAEHKSDAWLHARSVKLVNKKGSCSGEQVRAPSGVDYILTAAHCLPLAEDGVVKVIMEDGREIMRRVIAEDDKSDLLLLEGLPRLRGLDIAKSRSRAQHIRTFTHGSGLDTYKTEGALVQDVHVKVPLGVIEDGDEDADKACSKAKNEIGKIDILGIIEIKVCLLSVKETITTAMIVPGSSGGMVVDDSGDLIGVVSAGDGKFGALVTLEHIHEFLSAY